MPGTDSINSTYHQSIQIVPIYRKSSILSRPAFGCLKDVPSINLTRGCIHSCVYCYAKGFRSSPPKGYVYVYSNMAQKLEEELRKKKIRPNLVSFSTASDPFQPSEAVLDSSYRVMEILLKNSIGVGILTKGYIPDEFLSLFKGYSERVKIRIGIVSLSETYRTIFEPYSATLDLRISNIKRLMERGLVPQVRVDPIIPNLTDTEEEISNLFSKLKSYGIDEVSVSCLIMREYLLREFLGVPSSIRAKFLPLFTNQPYERAISSAKTKLLPKNLRAKIYHRFKSMGYEYGIKVRVCGCKNPDLPWEYCMHIEGNKREPAFVRHSLKRLWEMTKTPQIIEEKII